VRAKIFLLLLLLISGPIYAANAQVTSSIINKVYFSDEELTINFSVNSCRDVVRIKPYVDKGTVEIFNTKTSTWISNNNEWEKFPVLEPKMRLRVRNVSDQKVLLGFELQNTRLGTLTKSKGFTIWISDGLKDYIRRLNTQIAQETSQSTDAKLNR
jgi:hypothetical protein